MSSPDNAAARRLRVPVTARAFGVEAAVRGAGNEPGYVSIVAITSETIDRVSAPLFFAALKTEAIASKKPTPGKPSPVFAREMGDRFGPGGFLSIECEDPGCTFEAALHVEAGLDIGPRRFQVEHPAADGDHELALVELEGAALVRFGGPPVPEVEP